MMISVSTLWSVEVENLECLENLRSESNSSNAEALARHQSNFQSAT